MATLNNNSKPLKPDYHTFMVYDPEQKKLVPVVKELHQEYIRYIAEGLGRMCDPQKYSYMKYGR